jgi:DNA-binding NtrC family response regulator
MPRTTILWYCSELSYAVTRVFASLPGFEFTPVLHDQELPECAARITDGAAVIHVSSADKSRYLTSLQAVHNANQKLPIIIYDPNAIIQDPVDLIRKGAFCLLSGDLLPEKLNEILLAAIAYSNTSQLATLSAVVEERPWRKILIGESPEMRRVGEIIELIAQRRSTVLVTGETGTGKEVVAKAIHMASGRSRGPMVAVNCSAIPETLIEAELFGHAKGSFTGASASRIGRFEQANGGTIFLDEIGDLPLETQCKLLRVLQEREFERVGGTETIRVDVRVIAATNLDLAEAVKNKTFREDLYYRLKVVPVHLPPLRQRSGDIPLLVHHLTEKLCAKENIRPRYVTPEAMRVLERQEWRGNVRQLEHTIEMAIVLSGDRAVLDVSDFPFGDPLADTYSEPLLNLPPEGLDFDNTICEIQRYLLRYALEKAGGNKSRAAEMLGMKRSTLVSKVKTLC